MLLLRRCPLRCWYLSMIYREVWCKHQVEFHSRNHICTRLLLIRQRMGTLHKLLHKSQECNLACEVHVPYHEQNYLYSNQRNDNLVKWYIRIIHKQQDSTSSLRGKLRSITQDWYCSHSQIPNPLTIANKHYHRRKRHQSDLLLVLLRQLVLLLQGKLHRSLDSSISFQFTIKHSWGKHTTLDFTSTLASLLPIQA